MGETILITYLIGMAIYIFFFWDDPAIKRFNEGMKQGELKGGDGA